ncbi:MAG: NAD(P)-dependent oxidoreductase [Anaerolineaceae bacterium]|nr:NAD(P)-dependent oxidoreductase [Anaerolineaceae bacterium]
MKSVVVTGATSMMGSSLIRSLLQKKVEKIYAVVQEGSPNMSKLPADSKIECIQCNCNDYDKLSEIIKEKSDVFYHFAWLHSKIPGRERYFDVEVGYQNIGQTLKALSSAARLGCHTFVGAGSQAEYGNKREMIQKPDDVSDPITAYAIAKDACRRMCMLKAAELGIDVQWVRIFSVFGPHDRKNTMISTILPKLLRGEAVELTDCTQVWEYLYEDDAGDGLYYAGLAQGSNVFCLGSGEAKPLKAFVEEMKSVADSGSVIHYGAIPHTSEAVMNLHSDITKLKDATGWGGPKVSFGEGIRKIVSAIEET